MQQNLRFLQNNKVNSHLFDYLLGLVLSFSALAISIAFVLDREQDILFILAVMGCLCCVHVFSIVIASFAGWVFQSQGMTNESILNIWIHDIIIGLVVIPTLFVLFFVPSYATEPLLYVLFISIICFYVKKILRWISIFFTNKVSVFYLILYLCALEIVPILALYKVVHALIE